MVDMVTHILVACFDDFPVHPYRLWLLFFARIDRSGCIKRALSPQSEPFMLAQTPEIIGINDGVHSLCQRYPPEGIAVANPPKQKNWKNQQAFNQRRNVNNNLNDPTALRCAECII